MCHLCLFLGLHNTYIYQNVLGSHELYNLIHMYSVDVVSLNLVYHMPMTCPKEWPRINNLWPYTNICIKSQHDLDMILDLVISGYWYQNNPKNWFLIPNIVAKVLLLEIIWLLVKSVFSFSSGVHLGCHIGCLKLFKHILLIPALYSYYISNRCIIQRERTLSVKAGRGPLSACTAWLDDKFTIHWINEEAGYLVRRVYITSNIAACLYLCSGRLNVVIVIYRVLQV